MPDVWTFVLLAAGVFRLVRLVGWDDVTTMLRARLTVPDAAYPMLAAWVAAWQSWGEDPWRASAPWVQDHHARPGETPTAYLFPTTDLDCAETLGFLILDPFRGDRLPGRARFYAAKLVRCPWCVGMWIAAAWWAAWRAWPHATMAASTILALSAVAGLIAKHLDR